MSRTTCEECGEPATDQCQSCGTGVCARHDYTKAPYDHLCDACHDSDMTEDDTRSHTMKDREFHTLSFYEPTLAKAKDRLQRELDTEIVVAPHDVSTGLYLWAAKFARAWGSILECEDEDNVYVIITRARPSKEKREAIVDAIGKALDVDTVACHEDRFAAACEAIEPIE